MADSGNERLETDESFNNIKNYIRSEIEAIRINPEIGMDYLIRTGMYDQDGKLKPEFA